MTRKESKRQTVKTYREIESQGIPDIKCPKCGTYMDAGYMIVAKGLIFRRKHEALKLTGTGRLLPNTTNLGFKVKENLAWTCNTCQLVMIDYSFQIKK